MAGEFQCAYGEYTRALALGIKALGTANAALAVLYSNRSASATAMGAAAHALRDADAAVRLRPTWPRGHARRAAALARLDRIRAAVSAYDIGHCITAT